MNKKIISALLIGLSTTFAVPAVTASATEVKAVTANTQNGWVQSGSNWYYYINGKKHTGWIKPGNVWYYMNKDGIMQTGWLQENGKWYYLDNSGAMKTGWVQVSGKWYYMNNDGVMQTGWIQLSGKWYYLNTDGSMKTGWFKDTNGKQYYLNSSGEMLANTYTPDGYYVDANGVWDGKPATNGQAIVAEAQKYIGKPYVFGSNNAPYSFDCSSFTRYVIQKVTGKDITRVTTSQVLQGVSISKANLRPGDLVFFDNTYNGQNPTHVGIYIGNDKFIHASSGEGKVTTSSLFSNSYWSSHYRTARRIS